LFVIRSVLRKSKNFISDKYGEAKRLHAAVPNEGGFQVCTVVLHLSVPNFCSFLFDTYSAGPDPAFKRHFGYGYHVSKNIWFYFSAMVNGMTPLLGLGILKNDINVILNKRYRKDHFIIC
jgi:hypothetical protein